MLNVLTETGKHMVYLEFLYQKKKKKVNRIIESQLSHSSINHKWILVGKTVRELPKRSTNNRDIAERAICYVVREGARDTELLITFKQVGTTMLYGSCVVFKNLK